MIDSYGGYRAAELRKVAANFRTASTPGEVIGSQLAMAAALEDLTDECETVCNDRTHYILPSGYGLRADADDRGWSYVNMSQVMIGESEGPRDGQDDKTRAAEEIAHIIGDLFALADVLGLDKSELVAEGYKAQEAA